MTNINNVQGSGPHVSGASGAAGASAASPAAPAASGGGEEGEIFGLEGKIFIVFVAGTDC